MKKTLLIITLFFLALGFTEAKDVDYTKYTAFRFGMSIKQVQKICTYSNYTIEYKKGGGVGWWSVEGKLPRFINVGVSQSRLGFKNKKLLAIVYLSERDSLIKIEKELISNYDLDMTPLNEGETSFFYIAKRICLMLHYNGDLPEWDGEYFIIGKY